VGMLAAHGGEIGPLPRGEHAGLSALGPIEQSGDAGIGEQLVADQGQGGGFLGPGVGAAGRHHGLRIPVQYRRHAAEPAETLEAPRQVEPRRGTSPMLLVVIPPSAGTSAASRRIASGAAARTPETRNNGERSVRPPSSGAVTDSAPR